MDFGGFSFPIRRRGQFRDDDFFKGFHQDFDSAISGVMSRFGGRSLLADQFSSYRSLKDRLRDRENRSSGTTGGDESSSVGVGGLSSTAAASISETKDNYVIVLDMSDYVQGSMSVETKGRYVVVEARFGGNVFHRKYPLPGGTSYDAVVAALSDEGILTVTAPKKGSNKGPTKKTSTTDIRDDFPSTVRIDAGLSDRKDSVTSGRGKVVPLVLDEDVPTPPPTKTETPPNTPERSPEPHSPPPDSRKLDISKKGKFFQDEYFENVWQDFEKAMDEMVEKEQESEKKEITKEQLQSELVKEAQTTQQHLLQEQLKREQQEELLKESLEMELPIYSRMNSYRNLRQWAPAEESLAATLTKDSSGYKIVMDVKDYSDEGDLSINGTEEGLLVSGSKGGVSFERKFTLPGLSDPEKVNASMSADGVLTITAPTT